VAASKFGHNTLWHADFLKIVMADFCVCTSLYMLMALAPVCTDLTGGGSRAGLFLSFILFMTGVCLSSPFCNYWLDTYRRKSVALWGVIGIICATAVFLFSAPLWSKCLARVVQGASYGVFQIALGSTLLLDLSDTRMRTEAAHVYYWFTRLALVFGPLAGIIIPVCYGIPLFAALAVGLQVFAGMLILAVKVPFRAPLEPALCTLDRFWLPRGVRLFIPLFVVVFGAGVILGLYQEAVFYLCLAIGFWLSLCVHYLFFGRYLQGEFAMGYAALMICVLLCLSGDVIGVRLWAMAVSLGVGLGVVTSRYLLSYIRICEHCERGTAHTSYLLAWEAGLLAGYSAACAIRSGGLHNYTYIILAWPVVAGLFHFFFVREWYAKNKRR